MKIQLNVKTSINMSHSKIYIQSLEGNKKLLKKIFFLFTPQFISNNLTKSTASLIIKI